MKKTFNIEIKEVIQDTFEIEAENSEEAEYLAEKGFYDGEYVLDGVDAEHRMVSFIDKNSSKYISDNRKEKIINELINYVSEHSTDEREFYDALTKIIGLTNNEITELGIEVTIPVAIKPNAPLQKDEIFFENEIILVEDNCVNAYIPLYYIDIFEKFSLNEKNNYEYNLYLDYNIATEKCVMTIIEKDDNHYNQYQYEPTEEESKMLKEKLNEYCVIREGLTLEEFIEEGREDEEENI